MRARNKIINAYRRERREREPMPEALKEFKPTESISMTEYCVVPRPWDTHELIIEAVRIEDELNHNFKKMEVPKDMKYPEATRFKPAPMRAFFKEIVSSILP